ncbi:MAG TPA: FUSC family protein, partial [Stellaceae bacterium]
ERARDALGEMRAGTTGPGTMLAQLTVLLSAAARIGAAAVTLGEVAVPETAPRRAAIAELERSCRDAARLLLRGAGELALDPMRRRVQELGAGGEPERRADQLALAQAMRHLENADEALRRLFGRRRRLLDVLRLPLDFQRPSGAALATLRAHLTPDSAIFRHALRVAVVAALGTAVITRYALAHGIWLPLTSLVILQPEYGGTISRALQRTAGTIAGAVLAGVLLSAVHGTIAFDAALAALLFTTFALIRRRYGYAIIFLTPIVMLLIGAGSADPWVDLAERIAYTMVGAALALAAGYGLWPQWERERLSDRLAAAIRADRNYVVAALTGLGTAAPPDAALGQLRRQAEIAVGNADAAFQRMLGEPAHRRGRVDAGFTLLVYVHRLSRHTTALAAHLGVVVATSAPLDALRQLLAAALEDVAQAIGDGRAPAPRPDFDEPLAQLRLALSGGGEASPGRSVAALLDQVVSDATGLILVPAAARPSS